MRNAPSSFLNPRSLPSLDKALRKAISRRQAWTAASAWVVLLPIGWCVVALGCWMAVACWVSIRAASFSAPQLAITCLALIGGGLLFCISLLPASFALFKRTRFAFQRNAQLLTIRINQMEQESFSRQGEREALAEAQAISMGLRPGSPAAANARL